jgi:hypothetical protein
MRRLALVWVLAACGDDTGPPDARQFDAPAAGGTVSLTWSIADPEGTPLTCAEAGANLVGLTFRPADEPFGFSDVFGCAAGAGTSRNAPAGRYRITASLAGVTGVAGVVFDDVIIESGQNQPLGEAAFVVVPLGGFGFLISAGGQGNCTPPDQGGAGITAMQLELVGPTGACMPATFEIAAGATQPASTYTTRCGDPTPHACIAQDQAITVAPTLPAGTYRMTITGRVGAQVCWSRVPQFQVPSGQASADLGVQNLTRDPACAP